MTNDKSRKYVWTKQAFECYICGGICSMCSLSRFYGIKRCRIKEMVIKLIELGKKPPYLRGKTDIMEDEQK